MADKLSIWLVATGNRCLPYLQDLEKSDFSVTCWRYLEVAEWRQEQLPDLILLDCLVPEEPQWRVCQLIRQQFQIPYLPILFLCEDVGEGGKAQVYHEGGNDCLFKPADAVELLAKLTMYATMARQQQSLSHELQDSVSAAMLAIKENADYGLIISFIKRSSSCDSYAAVARLIFDTLATWHLSCFIKITSAHGQHLYDSHGELDPGENDIVEQVAGYDRIVDFQQRTIFSYRNIILTIRNMSDQQQVDCGRLKDWLSVMLSAVDVRLDSLNLQYDYERARSTELMDILKETLQVMSSIESQIAGQEDAAVAVVDSLVGQLEEAVNLLGLTEQQEQHLTTMLDATLEQLLSLRRFDGQLSSQFSGLFERFNVALRLTQSPTP